MRKDYLYIVISLLLSLFIYLFYRTEKTVINEMAIFLLSTEYFLLRKTVADFLPLNQFIIYSLPEGLWVFCIALTSKPFYVQLLNGKIDGVFIPLIFSIGLEVFQLFNITNGRFDFMDIWVSIVFWFFAYNFFKPHPVRQNFLKPVNMKSMVCLASYGIVYLSHVLE